MYADNITFYYGQERVINPVYGGMLRCELPGNLIVSNYHSEVYVLPNEPHRCNCTFHTFQILCTPDVEDIRYFNLTNASLHL